MGDEYNGIVVFLVHIVEDVHDKAAGLAVQRAGGLVRQNQRRFVHHGAGDGHTLLLATGQLVGLVLVPVAHAHTFQPFLSAAGALGGLDAGVQHGDLHVFEGALPGDEVVGLEHEPDFLVADAGQLVIGGLVDVHAVQQVAALGGAVQHTDDVHEGGFAGAGLAHHRHKLAGVDVQVDAVQNLQLVGLADVKALADAPHGNKRLRRGLRLRLGFGGSRLLLRLREGFGRLRPMDLFKMQGAAGGLLRQGSRVGVGGLPEHGGHAGGDLLFLLHAYSSSMVKAMAAS